jgi:predicted acetyltransferase
MPIGVELIQAGAEHQSVLENLLQFYIHDFSELIPLDVGNDGRYSYENLPLYWSDASRLAFLARFDRKLAGFVLITRISEASSDGEAYDMTEFFVLRRYRHRGIGCELAERVWLRCPGRWQIRVRANNVAALRFWESSIAKFTRRATESTSCEIDGTTWHTFWLDSRR